MDDFNETYEWDESGESGQEIVTAPFDYGAFVKRIREAESVRPESERNVAQVQVVNHFLPYDVATVGGWTCVSAVRLFEPAPFYDVCWVTLRNRTGDEVKAPGDHFSQAVREAIEIVREDKMGVPRSKLK